MQVQLNRIKILSMGFFKVSSLQNILNRFKTKEPDPKDLILKRLRIDIETARLDLHQREYNFEHAALEYVDVAIIDLYNAKKRYGVLWTEYKKLTSTK